LYLEKIMTNRQTDDLISREQVMEYENRLFAAMKIHDLETLDTLLHDDLLFNTHDGQTVTKAMDLDLHRSGLMVINSISASDYLVNLIGDTAIVAVTIETTGKIADLIMEGRFRYLRVWKMFDNKLKVVGGAISKL
jgi:hypothetical protein